MDRRRFLGGSAVAALGLALPRSRALAQAAVPVMSGLSTYMADAAERALPAEVVEHAKHHIVDTLAAMISGAELPPGKAAFRYVQDHAGKGATTIAGSSLTAGPTDAALANGVLAHADETDDSHGRPRRIQDVPSCPRRSLRASNSALTACAFFAP